VTFETPKQCRSADNDVLFKVVLFAKSKKPGDNFVSFVLNGMAVEMEVQVPKGESNKAETEVLILYELLRDDGTENEMIVSFYSGSGIVYLDSISL